jgi:hypothetical protein
MVRTLASGSTASILSSLAVAAHARARSGKAASGVNATSHWVWGERAMWRRRVDMRHTALGYAIHHASSLWWAGFFELKAPACRPHGVVALGAATAVTAYVVDYHVVPRRLTPGFERHLSPAGMVSAYAAFGAGLVVAHLLLRNVMHANPARMRARRREIPAAPAARTASTPAPAPRARARHQLRGDAD